MPLHDAALARVITQIQAARDHQRPLEIRAGGTKRFYGEQPSGEPLDVRPLAGISSYEPTELVVTARAGTLLSDLEAALAERGQCLPFEPPRFAEGGSVGGMVAAGLSGPSRASVGSVRDHLLGVTLLNAQGELLTFGGQVAKNVAGYDVTRLMAGSLGILGVICEVSLKVLPRSAATSTLSFACSEHQALDRFNIWRSQPLAINASAWHDDCLHVRLGGARGAVRAACDKLGGSLLGIDAAGSWWNSLRDQSHEFFAAHDAHMSAGECLWRLSMPPARPPVKLPGRQFIEWQGAQRWWWTNAPPREVREAAARLGGHATLMRGADKSGGVFTPMSAALLSIHRRLKQAFDPAGLFNPGRLYPTL